MSKKFIILIFILFSSSSWGQSYVLKVMKDETRFTIKKASNFSAGKEILLQDISRPGRIGRGVILECKVRSCLAEISDKKFRLRKGVPVTLKNSKRSHGAAASVDNILGVTLGLAYYYNFPHDPWMAGLKFRYIDNVTSDIKITGQVISLEAQRHLWNKSRFQVWATSEVGLMFINMNLSKINQQEPDISEQEYFLTVGLEARYNLTERLRLIGGFGGVYNTIDKSYKGQNGDYELRAKSFYPTGKIGLLYFF